MTLKQFFQIAGGAIISLLIYSSGLHPVIKWPLVFFSFLVGIALAFLPLQDRPLEVWILAFFKSIYSPTIYTWSKDKNSRQVFQPENVPTIAPMPVQPPVTPPQPVKSQPPVTVPAIPTPPTPPTPPAAPINAPIPVVNTVITATPPPIQKQENKVAVPSLEAVKVEPKEEIKVPSETTEPVKAEENQNEFYSPAAMQQVTGSEQANFSQDSAPPTPPTKANVIVGQVLGNNNEIVENAILEIKDAEGRSVRALRSNKLGHFMIITPLSDGRYDIITEKEGLYFNPVSINAKGELIPPIAIKASVKPIEAVIENDPLVPALPVTETQTQGGPGGDIYKTP
jgi:hypothetical protein